MNEVELRLLYFKKSDRYIAKVMTRVGVHSALNRLKNVFVIQLCIAGICSEEEVIQDLS